MTAKELAQHIVTRFMTFSNSTDCVSYTESLLTAALEEAYRKGFEELQKHRFESIAQAKAAAYEEGRKDEDARHLHDNKQFAREAYESCAEIAENSFNGCSDGDNDGEPRSSLEIAGDEIATKIRQRAEELK